MLSALWQGCSVLLYYVYYYNVNVYGCCSLLPLEGTCTNIDNVMSSVLTVLTGFCTICLNRGGDNIVAVLVVYPIGSKQFLTVFES